MWPLYTHFFKLLWDSWSLQTHCTIRRGRRPVEQLKEDTQVLLYEEAKRSAVECTLSDGISGQLLSQGKARGRSRVSGRINLLQGYSHLLLFSWSKEVAEHERWRVEGRYLEQVSKVPFWKHERSRKPLGHSCRSLDTTTEPWRAQDIQHKNAR